MPAFRWDHLKENPCAHGSAKPSENAAVCMQGQLLVVWLCNDWPQKNITRLRTNAKHTLRHCYCCPPTRNTHVQSGPWRRRFHSVFPVYTVTVGLVFSRDYTLEPSFKSLQFQAPKALPSCGQTTIVHCFLFYWKPFHVNGCWVASVAVLAFTCSWLRRRATDFYFPSISIPVRPHRVNLTTRGPSLL